MTKDYSYIIDDVCSGSKTPELVRKIIPILVKWAKEGVTTNTYGDLIQKLGRKKFSGIGHQLGRVDSVLKELGKSIGRKMPILNALVSNKVTHLPSYGMDAVYPGYSGFSKEQQAKTVELLNTEAISYKEWDYVLALLGLKPETSKDDEEWIRTGGFIGAGGEGEEHKRLKEYIAKNSKSIRVKSKVEGEQEHILLSGDRLDVYFPDVNTAIEVKPLSSPDGDILRGLYQCVKYKAILDAEAAVDGREPNGKTMLVIEGKLSQSNKNVRDILGVKVIENFRIKQQYGKK